jgi:hypothetical protein
MPHPRRRGCPRVEAGVVALARYIGPGLPPPKYIPASAVEDAQPSCSAVMHDARQHETPEHVRCADLSLLHDFGPFTSCPAKKLNPKLIASRCLRYCAFEFVQSATLWERLKRPRSDGFAVRGRSASRHPASTELLFMYTMGAIDHDQAPSPFITSSSRSYEAPEGAGPARRRRERSSSRG